MRLLSLQMTNRTGWTHVKDVKDSDNVLLPNGDLVLVTLHENESGIRSPFTFLSDLPLDLGHGPAI